jgi:hypothetical protein
MALLPHKVVSPKEMAELVKNKERKEIFCKLMTMTEASPFMIYFCVVTVEDYIEPNDRAAKFDKNEYYAHPERYHSIFYETVVLVFL